MIQLPTIIVSKDVFQEMKNKRASLIKKYSATKDYKDLLLLRENCNNSSVCKSLDTIVSNYVKGKWGGKNVDETINGETQAQAKDTIILELEQLWRISAYLNKYKPENKTMVNMHGTGRDDSPLNNFRTTYNRMLKYLEIPQGTNNPITSDAKAVTDELLVEHTPNVVLDILKGYAVTAVVGALSGFIMYLVLKQKEKEGMEGGGDKDDAKIAKELTNELIEAGVTKGQVNDYINTLTQEQKKQILDKVSEKVSEKDFAEFGLSGDETVFGFMDTGSRGGKRKRSTKRSAKKNKKNKKSNRKRKA